MENYRPKTQTTMAWVVTVTSALFFFYEFIQLNLFNAINTDLMQAFHLDAPQLGQLASMYFYANAIFLFPAGLLLDRFSTKKLILFSIILATIGTFWFAIATSYYTAAIARFLIGTGAAFCFLGPVRVASRWFPPGRMALVTGIIVTMAMMGGMVAQTPMALLSNLVGWRQAVLIDAGLGGIITLAILFFVQDCPADYHEAEKAHKVALKNMGLWRSILLAVSNPQNWLGGIYTSLLNAPVFLLGALWGINYLTEVHHLTLVDASYATTLFFMGAILGSPAYGWFSDHIGLRRLPMIIGGFLSLGVILMLMYIPNLSLFSIITLFFMIGFFTSSQVLSYPTVAELNPHALTGTSVSIVSISIMSSGFIFQPLFGWMMQLSWDHHLINNLPVYAAQDFKNAMWIMPIGFVLGILIALMIKETYCQSKEFTPHLDSATRNIPPAENVMKLEAISSQ